MKRKRGAPSSDSSGTIGIPTPTGLSPSAGGDYSPTQALEIDFSPTDSQPPSPASEPARGDDYVEAEALDSMTSLSGEEVFEAGLSGGHGGV